MESNNMFKPNTCDSASKGITAAPMALSDTMVAQGNSDCQSDASPLTLAPDIHFERLVTPAVARPHQPEIALPHAVAKKQASIVRIALIGGPDEAVSIGKTVMDGFGPQDGLAELGRARRNKVPARNAPTAQRDTAQLDKAQVTHCQKLRMSTALDVVPPDRLDRGACRNVVEDRFMNRGAQG